MLEEIFLLDATENQSHQRLKKSATPRCPWIYTLQVRHLETFSFIAYIYHAVRKIWLVIRRFKIITTHKTKKELISVDVFWNIRNDYRSLRGELVFRTTSIIRGICTRKCINIIAVTRSMTEFNPKPFGIFFPEDMGLSLRIFSPRRCVTIL